MDDLMNISDTHQHGGIGDSMDDILRMPSDSQSSNAMDKNLVNMEDLMRLTPPPEHMSAVDPPGKPAAAGKTKVRHNSAAEYSSSPFVNALFALLDQKAEIEEIDTAAVHASTAQSCVHAMATLGNDRWQQCHTA